MERNSWVYTYTLSALQLVQIHIAHETAFRRFSENEETACWNFFH